MKKMSFLWWFGAANEIYPYWRDGLRAAIEEIGKDHDVDLYLGEYEPEGEYDWHLIWADSNCPLIPLMDKHKGKKGLILTTMPQNFDYLRKLDIVFCESRPVYEAVRAQGIRAMHAFATDTDFYTPDPTVEKDIDVFYPATFSPWKMQRDIAYLGDKLWCVGTVQPDGQEDLQACLDNGVHVAQGYYKAEHIRDLYRRAKSVMIPAVHGSERTVLEAMSTDILPRVIRKDNHKTYSFIREFNTSGMKSPREFVLKNYNHKDYAKKILRGFE